MADTSATLIASVKKRWLKLQTHKTHSGTENPRYLTNVHKRGWMMTTQLRIIATMFFGDWSDRMPDTPPPLSLRSFSMLTVLPYFGIFISCKPLESRKSKGKVFFHGAIVTVKQYETCVKTTLPGQSTTAQSALVFITSIKNMLALSSFPCTCSVTCI